jgi:hypothetical protein
MSWYRIWYLRTYMERETLPCVRACVRGGRTIIVTFGSDPCVRVAMCKSEPRASERYDDEHRTILERNEVFTYYVVSTHHRSNHVNNPPHTWSMVYHQDEVSIWWTAADGIQDTITHISDVHSVLSNTNSNTKRRRLRRRRRLGSVHTI